MPTVADLRRLAELEQAFGVAHGTHGQAVLELAYDVPVPRLEFDDGFEGDVVVIRSGALKSDEHRLTVNGEWRSGLPPIRYGVEDTPWVAANDGTRAATAEAPASSENFSPAASSRGT